MKRMFFLVLSLALSSPALAQSGGDTFVPVQPPSDLAPRYGAYQPVPAPPPSYQLPAERLPIANPRDTLNNLPDEPRPIYDPPERFSTIPGVRDDGDR